MSILDWSIFIFILSFFCFLGIFISRKHKNYKSFLVSNYDLPWYLILIGIMCTQAGAITYLSLPGTGYNRGFDFIQFYFGLPFAILVVIFVFVPIYKKLNLVSIYSYLEQRFNPQTRILIVILFLLSRSLATGIGIFAPAIVLSSILNIPIFYVNILLGGVLIVYTSLGGARTVSRTQIWYFLCIIFCLIFIVIFLISQLATFPPLNFTVADLSGKLKFITNGMIDTSFDWKDKYNIWSGLIGGFFLQLSYFGTDQSQASRYLIGKNLRSIKLGLLLNGLIKIPFQIFILFIGVLIFSYFQRTQEPIYFNQELIDKANLTPYKNELQKLEQQFNIYQDQEKFILDQNKPDQKHLLSIILQQKQQIKSNYLEVIKKAVPNEDVNDSNFIFAQFITHHLPIGFIGFFMAMIFLAAWGAIAPALHSLAQSTFLEIPEFFPKAQTSEKIKYKYLRYLTVFWGIFCVSVSELANHLGSLIEAVNVIGSLFYGVILGVFLVGFFLHRINGKTMFYNAIFIESIVILLFFLDRYNFISLSYLWLNAVGCLCLIISSFITQLISQQIKKFRPS